MKHKTLVAFGFGAILLITTPFAHAGLVQIDLSAEVNLGFQNSWFINGNEFSSILGSTNGNQGSGIPFNVANVADSSGQGGSNNFWFGLWGGPGNQLFGTPLSVTIPVNQTATTVYNRGRSACSVLAWLPSWRWPEDRANFSRNRIPIECWRTLAPREHPFSFEQPNLGCL